MRWLIALGQCARCSEKLVASTGSPALIASKTACLAASVSACVHGQLDESTTMPRATWRADGLVINNGWSSARSIFAADCVLRGVGPADSFQRLFLRRASQYRETAAYPCGLGQDPKRAVFQLHQHNRDLHNGRVSSLTEQPRKPRG